jgi:SAM-dependent methyltransferase
VAGSLPAVKATIRGYLEALWRDAEEDYKIGLLSLVERDPSAVFADLGCDDGTWTERIAGRIGTSRVIGVDVESDRSKQAKQRGVEVRFADLNDRFPFYDAELDVVHSNQVIEHIQDLDHFVCEIYRALRPGGYAAVCTENLASWHNIVALMGGLQPFSLTNVSTTGVLGNPFSLHRSKLPGYGLHAYKTFFHTRVLAYRAFHEIFAAHGFTVEAIGGTGYHPLPRPFARFLSKIDPRHAHFIYLKARKPG